MHNNLKKAFENKYISKILNEILDKFDKQAFRKNKVSIVLNEKNFLALYFPKEFNEDIDLEFDLKVLLDYGVFQLKHSKKSDEFLPFVEKKNAKFIFDEQKENLLREVYNRKKVLSKKQDWNSLLENYFQKESALYEILEKSPFFIEDKTNEEVLKNLKLWVESKNKTSLQRHESSKCFWGISKAFDNKEEFCAYFNLQEKPILIQVHGKSSKASKILFIENLETFSSCIDSQNQILDDFILINSHGYKTSAKRVRQKNGSKLFFSSSCTLDKQSKEDFISWFYSDDNKKEVYFWGDLDEEGISILSSHQKAFTSLKAWQKAYEIMIKEVLKNNAHLANNSNKKEQKLIENTTCTYTNEVLIPILKEKRLFIDQEFVNIDGIK